MNRIDEMFLKFIDNGNSNEATTSNRINNGMRMREMGTHTQKKCVLMLIFVASKYVSVCKSVRKTIHVSSKSAAFDAET